MYRYVKNVLTDLLCYVHRFRNIGFRIGLCDSDIAMSQNHLCTIQPEFLSNAGGCIVP
jgi:hypothetical protein